MLFNVPISLTQPLVFAANTNNSMQTSWIIMLITVLTFMAMTVVYYQKAQNIQYSFIKRLVYLKKSFVWLSLATVFFIPVISLGREFSYNNYILWGSFVVLFFALVTYFAITITISELALKQIDTDHSIAYTILFCIIHKIVSHITYIYEQVVYFFSNITNETDSNIIRNSPVTVIHKSYGRKVLVLCGVLLLSIAAMLLAITRDEVMITVSGQYLALLSFSVLLAYTPGIIAVWTIIVYKTNKPRISASLQIAGDITSRGLVVGLITGIATFTLIYVLSKYPTINKNQLEVENFFTLGTANWLELTLGLSVVGSVIGFAASQLSLLELACRSCKYPRLAWLLTPLLVFVVLFVNSVVLSLDPRSIYADLARSLIQSLPPIAPENVTLEDLSRDWRYVFAGVGEFDRLEIFPCAIIFSLICAALIAFWLWRSWHLWNDYIKSAKQPIGE